jgi:hypothetical protein
MVEKQAPVENVEANNKAATTRQDVAVAERLLDSSEPKRDTTGESQTRGLKPPKDATLSAPEVSLTQQQSEEVQKFFTGVKNATQSPKEFGEAMANGMEKLGAKLTSGSQNGSDFKTITMPTDNGQLSQKFLRDGTVETKLGDKPVTTYKPGTPEFEAGGKQVVASLTDQKFPNNQFSKMEQMANGDRKFTLKNQADGATEMTLTPSAANGVKWTRSYADGRTVSARSDDSYEIKKGDQKLIVSPEGKLTNAKVTDAPVRAPGDNAKVEVDKVNVPADTVKPAAPERKFTTSENGEVKQTFGPEPGKVTTSMEKGKIASITYNPNDQKNPYSVQFRDGKADPQLEKQVKDGQFAINVNKTDIKDGDFFKKDFNQIGPVDGSKRVMADGSVASELGNGKTRTDFPPNHPSGRSYETVTRDAQGKVTNVERDGTDKAKGAYTETLNYQQNQVERKYADQKYPTEKGLIDPNQAAKPDLDDRGYVKTVKVGQGPRAGQEYSFKNDELGRSSEMKIKVPGKDGAAPQEVTLKKNSEGKWQTNPPDGKVPGFDNLKKDSAGNIIGDFKVNKSGDVLYDAGDGNKEVVRANGNKDVYNLNDYSRVTETPDGQQKTTYWDGYEWRGGNMTRKEDGTVTVKFDGQPGDGKPTEITRDARTNADGTKNDNFKVNFQRQDNTFSYDANWKQQKITMNDGSSNKPVDLYNTGVRNRDGRMLWMQGQQSTEPGKENQVQFSPRTAEEQQAMLNNEVPMKITYDRNGKMISEYNNQTKVQSDGKGNVEQIRHRNGQQTGIVRDVNNDIVGVASTDGTSMYRDGQTTDADGKPTAKWKIEKNGKPVGTTDGAIDISSNGTTSLKGADGQTKGAIDTNGQRWERADGGKPGDKPKWKVSSNGKDYNYEGNLKEFPNGVLAVETSANKFQTRNLDNSQSTIDQTGLELARDFDNGAFIHRDSNGRVSEMKNSKGDVRQFKYKQGQSGEPVLDQVLVNGKVSEVVRDGNIRVLKEGADPNSTNTADLGDTVNYNPYNGERTTAGSDGKPKRTEGLHGDWKEYNAEGKVTKGKQIDAASNTALEFDGNGRVTTLENTKSGIKRHFNYSEGGTVPVSIDQTGKDGKRENIATKVPGESLHYKMTKSGELAGLDVNSGDLTTRSTDQKTGDSYGLLRNSVDGTTTLEGPNGEVISKTDANGRITQFRNAQGQEHTFTYDDKNNISKVEKTIPGPPARTVVTDEAKDGKLMSVKNPDAGKEPREYEGESSYNPSTGSRTVTVRDAAGKVKGSIETFADGGSVVSDENGKRLEGESAKGFKDHYENGKLKSREFKNGVKAEFDENEKLKTATKPGEWTDTYENGVRTDRNMEGGGKIKFDKNTGLVSSTVDVDGVERKFTYEKVDNGQRIQKVESRDTTAGADAPFRTVEQVDDKGMLRQVKDGKPTGDRVLYGIFGDNPDGSRYAVAKDGKADGSGAAWTQTYLDGSTAVKPENGPAGQRTPRKVPARAGK